MRGFLSKHKQFLSTILLAVALSVFIAGPFYSAKAVVPVLDSANLSVNTATAKGVGALVAKEYTLDPLAWIAKFIIRALRDMVIRWIVTGQFGFPSFQTSFTVDPARIAENASRIFLSQLTGINFCSFALDIPSPLNFRIAEDFGLSCSLPPGLNANYQAKLIQWIEDPYSLSLEERWAFTDPQANKAYLYVDTLDRKAEAEAKALIARAAEVASGGGFIGQRDPATGKIKTPGRVITNYLQEAIGSNFREGDVADELSEAIVAILDTLIGKIINDGLGTIFGGS
ncbi:hypothetical protein HY374_00745 [Candidatus Berkelbacteria bacterium]|nr:hypothetical protein [Candidatus Berkelbacteria bacterium]